MLNTLKKKKKNKNGNKTYPKGLGVSKLGCVKHPKWRKNLECSHFILITFSLVESVEDVSV